jgi:pyrimidine-specific ribonucleoside hydrolase
MNTLFDMETADPDDFLTLCFLLSHPKVDLKAVTVTPGGKKQVGLVKMVLERMGVDIPVGARTPDHPKNAVSGFYNKVLGDIPEREADAVGWEVIYDAVQNHNDLTVITGAPLSNLYNMLDEFPFRTVKRWVAQGGFAGDNIVPKEYRLEKFDGMLTCPTFNFNGNPKAAEFLLSTDRIEERLLISKNVCHGEVYTKELHERYEDVKDRDECTKLIYKAMDIYLKKKPNGKKLHDPLAACAAIDPRVCEFKRVEMYREKGKWGAKRRDDSNTWISWKANREIFHNVWLFKDTSAFVPTFLPGATFPPGSPFEKERENTDGSL